MNLKARLLIAIGIILTGAGLSIIGMTFYPIIFNELTFAVRSIQTSIPEETPIDDAFGIIIPKLGANGRIIANIDPYDEKEYQYALTQGVAHAKGTAFPGTVGNVFLFSHSSVNFYDAIRYNSIFYLISKLEKGDEIDLYYKKNKYVYRVTEKKMVDPKDTSYLTKETSEKTVTMMTCWPPGTTYKRLLVRAILTH